MLLQTGSVKCIKQLRPNPFRGVFSFFSEDAGEMLQKDHRVMFLKLFEQPLPLLHRYALAGGNVMQKLFEALQGCCLSLVFVLLWCHLLAEGERCNTEQGKGAFLPAAGC